VNLKDELLKGFAFFVLVVFLLNTLHSRRKAMTLHWV